MLSLAQLCKKPLELWSYLLCNSVNIIWRHSLSSSPIGLAMTIIIKTLKQGNRNLAASLIQSALPYQINQCDQYGQTALHIAVQKNYLDIIELLLEKGANINALGNDPSYKNMTALNYAALTGNLAATKLLLAWGANPALKNSQHHAPIVTAYQHGFVEVARTIQRHKGDQHKPIWPPSLPATPAQKTIQQSLIRKPLELKTSSIESQHARVWLQQNSKNSNNIVDFSAYKKEKLKNHKS